VCRSTPSLPLVLKRKTTAAKPAFFTADFLIFPTKKTRTLLPLGALVCSCRLGGASPVFLSTIHDLPSTIKPLPPWCAWRLGGESSLSKTAASMSQANHLGKAGRAAIFVLEEFPHGSDLKLLSLIKIRRSETPKHRNTEAPKHRNTSPSIL
jgi:hypothetical protein